jgi:hypothetical protein
MSAHQYAEGTSFRVISGPYSGKLGEILRQREAPKGGDYAKRFKSPAYAAHIGDDRTAVFEEEISPEKAVIR